MAPDGDLDVVGIGSMVVDRMHRAARLLGEDGKDFLLPLSGGALVERHVGGVVLNHLGWAAALGVRCGIFGRQGDDEDGRFLRAAMDERTIARDILLVDEPTSLAEIFVDPSGERAIYMAEGATRSTSAAQVREQHAAFIARAARVTTEVSQLPLEAALAALEVAGEAGAERWVDLDIPPSVALATLGDAGQLEAVLRAADVLKPSKAALAEWFEVTAHSDALELAAAVRERFGTPVVVVTDGERGCAIHSAAFQGRLAGLAVEAVDTTGAGDAFLGGLLAARAAGLAWDEAGAFASALAAVCVGQFGAFPLEPAAARSRALQLYDGPTAPLQGLAARR